MKHAEIKTRQDIITFSKLMKMRSVSSPKNQYELEVCRRINYVAAYTSPGQVRANALTAEGITDKQLGWVLGAVNYLRS